jgi:hypothetical protein
MVGSWQIWASYVLGLISQAALFAYALAPSEQVDLGVPAVTTEALVLVQAHQIFASLHTLSTLALTYAVQRAEIIKSLQNWMSVKVSVALLVCLLAPIDLMATLTAAPSWLGTAPNLIGYLLLLTNAAYVGLFYHDLKSLTIAFNYKSEIKEYKVLNEATF